MAPSSAESGGGSTGPGGGPSYGDIGIGHGPSTTTDPPGPTDKNGGHATVPPVEYPPNPRSRKPPSSKATESGPEFNDPRTSTTSLSSESEEEPS